MQRPPRAARAPHGPTADPSVPPSSPEGPQRRPRRSSAPVGVAQIEGATTHRPRPIGPRAAFAWGVALLLACSPGAPPTPSPEPAAPTATPTTPTEAPSGERTSAPGDEDERAPVPAATLAGWINDALQRGESAVVQHALEEVSRELAYYRGQWDAELLMALRRTTAPSVAHVLRPIDTRFVAALFEALVDGQDYAGLVRATEGRDRGAAAELVAPVRALAESMTERSGTLRTTGCADAAANVELRVLPGTHEVVCSDARTLVFLGLRDEVTVHWSDAGPVVDPPARAFAPPPSPAPRTPEELAAPPLAPHWR